MPDILTRADYDESQKRPQPLGQAFHAEIRHYNDGYGCTRQELVDRLLIAVAQSGLKENGLPVPENASERDSGSSSPIPASSTTPETVTISLPALRATILSIIDDGDKEGLNCDCRELWPLWHPFSDCANDARMRFCDELERRLRQLPARD